MNVLLEGEKSALMRQQFVTHLKGWQLCMNANAFTLIDPENQQVKFSQKWNIKHTGQLTVWVFF